MSDKTWHLTCGVSQLPIVREDPVAIFLLVRNQIIKGNIVDHPRAGFYYADNIYQPLAPAIKGQYREHGRFQLLNSPLAIDELKEHINQHLVDPTTIISNTDIVKPYIEDMKSGYNRHLNEVDRFEQLMNKISAGSLPGISFMAIHLDLYNKMVELSATKDPIISLKERLLSSMTQYMIADIENQSKHLKDNPITKKIKRHNAMAPLITGYNLIGNSTLANDLVDFFLVHDALDDNRKLWQPQAGAGGIEDNFELTIAIGEFATKKYIQQLKKK